MKHCIVLEQTQMKNHEELAFAFVIGLHTQTENGTILILPGSLH